MTPPRTTSTVWFILFSRTTDALTRYGIAVDDAAKVIEKYNRFAERVDELGLQDDVDAKPILDVRFRATMSHVLFAKSQYCAFGSIRRAARSYESLARRNPASGLAKCLLR